MTDILDETELSYPRVAHSAPAFAAESTQGPLHFPADFRGRWIVLFSYPEDFSPVSTTELMAFASLHDQFEDLNVQLLAVSIEGLLSHIAWIRAIRESIVYRDMKEVDVHFPVIDDSSRRVAHLYGMVVPGEDSTQTVRSTFIIDPAGVIRAILQYPRDIGRSVDEVLRIVTALKSAGQFSIATPADWLPGDDVVVPPGTRVDDEGQERHADSAAADWFFHTRSISADEIKQEITVSGLRARHPINIDTAP